MVSGVRRRLVKLGLGSRAVLLALQTRRSPLPAWRTIRSLFAFRKRARRAGFRFPSKYVRAAGRWFPGLYTPGWPSAAFDRYVLQELSRFAGGEGPDPRPHTLVFAITKKCPLRCEHCYEWDALNRPDTLTLDDLRGILAKFQDQGVVQVQFTGGEPLTRFDDLLALLRSARDGTDLWVITSGHGLTPERARALRCAGLTGVIVSLDHWDPVRHDAFRGRVGAFEAVKRASRSANAAGLVLALSLCATRIFVSAENLRRYARLARELGAGFLQILEARAVGHYAGKDVALGTSELDVLEAFHAEMNFGRAYRDMPIVEVPALAQRWLGGCTGAGDRYVYVDTDGDVHACPFCHLKAGSALATSLDPVLAGLRRRGCPVGASALPADAASCERAR